MSATPPFGPAYDQPPDDGQGRRPDQWRPQAGQPQGGRPQAGGPGAGGPQAGRPQAGGPQAGRPQGDQPRVGGRHSGAGQPVPQRQPSPYQSPQAPRQPSPHQTGSVPASPATPPHGAPAVPPQGEPRRPQPRPAAPGAPPQSERAPEPFEEAAFADDAAKGDWSGNQTTAIGRMGYSAKEPRRRSDFQKKRSRARKSGPLPKIIAAVVVLGLIGGGVYLFMNWPGEEEPSEEAGSGLAYEGSEEPCGFADTAPLAEYTGGGEPESAPASEQKNSGFEQACTMTFGEADSSTALLEFDGIAYESNERAKVSYNMEAQKVAELTDTWTVIESAPEVGSQTAAVARVAEDDSGTSNYQLHVQDENAYLVVRLSLVGSGLDEEGLGELTGELASSYLSAWKDA